MSLNMTLGCVLELDTNNFSYSLLALYIDAFTFLSY